MDEDGAWRAIDVQRLAVVELLTGLSGDQWQRPSLCEGWTVRDVAAHLTMQQMGVRDVLSELARGGARSNMNRFIRDSARRRAQWSTDDIIAGIRATVGSRRHNVGVGYRETLIDILVHSQDIALPLSHDLAVPADVAAVAADRVWERRWPFFAATRLRGFRLSATDAAWQAGQGEQVSGRMADLLLISTGRRMASSELSGAGADGLRARLGVAPA